MAISRKKSRGHRLVAQLHGGALIPGAGRGCKPGAANAGRPPDEWREALRGLASREDVIAHIEGVLAAGPEDPFFWRALDYATEHGFGKASNTLAVTPLQDCAPGAVFLLPPMAPRPEPPEELIGAGTATRLRPAAEQLRPARGAVPK